MLEKVAQLSDEYELTIMEARELLYRITEKKLE